jgi:hypothetical protein
MKSNLQTVIDFLKIQIEGEPVPPAGSVAWNELEHAIQEIQIHNSTNEQAMLGLLVGHKIGIKKRDVVTHFEGRYEKGPIYRAMKALVTAGAVHEAAGMVCAAGVAK